jgi:hypothetical protein
MIRGSNPTKSPVVNQITFYAAFLGGGAAANGSVPSNGVFSAATSTYPKAANLGTSCTYISTGVYDVVLADSVKNILWADAKATSGGASPTAALDVVVFSIVPSTKTIRVKVYTPAGALTDLGTSDMLILKIDAADTSAIN